MFPTAIVSQLSGREAPRPTMTGASGYASFDFFQNGQIRYQVIYANYSAKDTCELKLGFKVEHIVKTSLDW